MVDYKDIKIKSIVTQTDKAILFNSEKGDFWCPKSLIGDISVKKGYIFVYVKFNPDYLKPRVEADKDDFDDTDDTDDGEYNIKLPPLNKVVVEPIKVVVEHTETTKFKMSQLDWLLKSEYRKVSFESNH